MYCVEVGAVDGLAKFWMCKDGKKRFSRSFEDLSRGPVRNGYDDGGINSDMVNRLVKYD